MRECSGDMSNIILEPRHEKKYIEYVAGQYIQIKTPDDGLLPFSIANAPRDDHRLELLIRHSANDPVSQRLIKNLRDLKIVDLVGPLGDCVYSPQLDRPLLLI